MPTIFTVGLFNAARKTNRPIRPKPLIPILTTVLSSLYFAVQYIDASPQSMLTTEMRFGSEAVFFVVKAG
jgi:hypothetical protein